MLQRDWLHLAETKPWRSRHFGTVRIVIGSSEWVNWVKAESLRQESVQRHSGLFVAA